jgi:transcriptional regulator with GAF, ATPase, and Fis domain
MVARKEFRSDLYYRVNVFPVALPPLRERRQDIPQLTSHFVEICARRMGKQIDHIPQDMLAAFTAYSWPGNVRELQNLVERAVIRSNNGVLTNPLVASGNLSNAPVPLRSTFSDSQRALILRALEVADWVIGGSGGAAARLGLKRTTLIAKMKKLGISRPVPTDDRNELTDSFEGRPVPSCG